MVGDLVTYQGRPYKVLSEDSGLRALTLIAWDGAKVQVADDDQDLGTLVSPGSWPFVVAPKVSLAAKRPLRLTRVVAGETVELVPLVEWSPTSILQRGGPIFFKPSLRLRRGEVLVLHYEGGMSSRLVIHPGFGSIGQRRTRSMGSRVPVRESVYDFLLEEEDEK